MQYIKPEIISLKNHPEFNEAWLQKRIADDPSILGLGDLAVRERERRQRHGRLDFLLQDPDPDVREWYEVEVQLGQTDESHIIRTIEYWDEERKRYSDIEHTAVIVAEEITSRFFNVISLFNGTIPLIAIQLQAVKIGDTISIVATKVLDKVQPSPEEIEIDDIEVDRNYWVQRSSKQMVELADEMLSRAQKHDPKLDLKYNKHYIGLAKNDQGFNFVSLTPKRHHAWLSVRLASDPKLDERLEQDGLDARYDKGFRVYNIRLTEHSFATNTSLLDEVIEAAYKRRMAT